MRPGRPWMALALRRSNLNINYYRVHLRRRIRSVNPSLLRTKQNSSKRISTSIIVILTFSRKHLPYHKPKMKCDQCPQLVATSKELKRHLVTHTKEKRDESSVTCPFCLEIFTRRDNCRKHVKNFHGQVYK